MLNGTRIFNSTQLNKIHLKIHGGEKMIEEEEWKDEEDEDWEEDEW